MTCPECEGTGRDCGACGGSGIRAVFPTGEYLAIIARSWPDSAMYEPRATVKQLTGDIKRATLSYAESQSVADRTILEAAERALEDFTVFYSEWAKSH